MRAKTRFWKELNLLSRTKPTLHVSIRASHSPGSWCSWPCISHFQTPTSEYSSRFMAYARMKVYETPLQCTTVYENNYFGNSNWKFSNSQNVCIYSTLERVSITTRRKEGDFEHMKYLIWTSTNMKYNEKLCYSKLLNVAFIFYNI